MRYPPADLVDAMQPFRAAVLRKRPELWEQTAGMDIDGCARAIGKPAGEDEGTVALLRRLTAALEAEPVLPGPLSPLPSVPGRPRPS